MIVAAPTAVAVAAVLLVAMTLVACAPLRPVMPPTRPTARRPAPMPVPTAAANPAAFEDFEGHYRAAAKTAYVLRGSAPAPAEVFPDLEALKAFLRPQIDPLMRHRYPHLSEADTDDRHRVPEERHNVAVIAYLHAVKHESGPHGDRDFHVMLGSSPTAGQGIFITAEASALPAAGAERALLAAARTQLLALVGVCRCDGRFMAVAPPIRVRVTGSLFFDGAHGIGSVGPAYAKPFTVWEIHPLLSIERLGPAARE